MQLTEKGGVMLLCAYVFPLLALFQLLLCRKVIRG